MNHCLLRFLGAIGHALAGFGVFLLASALPQILHGRFGLFGVEGIEIGVGLKAAVALLPPTWSCYAIVPLAFVFGWHRPNWDSLSGLLLLTLGAVLAAALIVLNALCLLHLAYSPPVAESHWPWRDIVWATIFGCLYPIAYSQVRRGFMQKRSGEVVCGETAATPDGE